MSHPLTTPHNPPIPHNHNKQNYAPRRRPLHRVGSRDGRIQEAVFFDRGDIVGGGAAVRLFWLLWVIVCDGLGDVLHYMVVNRFVCVFVCVSVHVTLLITTLYIHTQ